MTAGGDDFTISMAGESAVLLDLARGAFRQTAQDTIWAMAARLRDLDGVRETVPGMNNLLVLFDPLSVASGAVEAAIRGMARSGVGGDIVGRTIEIPVIYGGRRGEDLPGLAKHCGLDPVEVARRHAGGVYRVAAIGAMPGFPYLSGLDPTLAMGRRPSPRMAVAEGSVVIGGAQAGIMPITAPSGWHIIGHTDIKLFDAAGERPTLLMPGDSVRFVAAGVKA